MTAREYLNRIEKIDKTINELLDELNQLKILAYGTSVSTENERVQSSLSGDKLCDAVTKIVTLENEIDRLTDEFYDLKSEALQIMERMKSNKQYNILYERYINYKSIYTIAKEKKKNYQNMKKLHAKALQEYQKQLDIVVRKK